MGKMIRQRGYVGIGNVSWVNVLGLIGRAYWAERAGQLHGLKCLFGLGKLLGKQYTEQTANSFSWIFFLRKQEISNPDLSLTLSSHINWI